MSHVVQTTPMDDQPQQPFEPPENASPESHHESSEQSHQSVKVNLDQPLKTHRLRRKLKMLVFGLLGIVGMAMVGFGIYAYQFTKTNITDKTEQRNFFGQVRRIIDSDVEPLRGEDEDRINVLLLGQGGENHPGGTLVDTIMIASFQPSTNRVALLSLPRDLVVPYYLNESTYPEYRKINNAVYFGGIELAKEKITDVTGLEIHYYALVDFAAFRDIINSIGGIAVTVENPFTDYEYPDYNYGYQTIRFDVGEQLMDGETALQFARSRHGNNGEGSDFARALRQQMILEAVREKLLSLSTVLNPAKVTGVLNDVGDHVSTDMEIWEMLRFAELAKNIDRDAVTNRVVDNSEGGLLVNERGEEGAYILVPRLGLENFSEIRHLAKTIFDEKPAEQERAVIAIQNGTTVTGLATLTAHALRNQGMDVNTATNALTKQVTQTVVYDVSGGTLPLTAEVLEDYFGLSAVSASMPSTTNSTVRVATDVDPQRVDIKALPANVDFIILLGSDAATSQNPTNTAL